MIYIDKLKKFKIAVVFIVLLRIVLGLSFIYPGIPKILGHRFTTLGTDTPVGYFFEAMYQTGFYWRFLGIAQILTGMLLISQRYATLGAVLYFPIILNIFILTASMGFTGTPYVTFMMLLAGVLLLIWDYDKLKYIFVK